MVKEFQAMGGSIFEAQTSIQYEQEVPAALEELKNAGCNALAVFRGNFGPEGPETMLAERFDGPCMFFAAAEENIGVLSSRRGDAYCGMLSMSVNMKLRGLKPYIPEYPVGTAQECAKMLMDFVPVARALIDVYKRQITDCCTFCRGIMVHRFLAMSSCMAGSTVATVSAGLLVMTESIRV